MQATNRGRSARHNGLKRAKGIRPFLLAGLLCLIAAASLLPALSGHALADTTSPAGSSTAASSGTNPPAATSTIEEALRDGAQARGVVYAGDCASTRSPQDVGKYCTKFVAMQGEVRAYLAGATFSEFRYWVFVHHTANGWVLSSIAHYDDTVRGAHVPWPSVAAQ